MPNEFGNLSAGGAGANSSGNFSIASVAEIFLKPTDIPEEGNRANDNDFFYSEFETDLEPFTSAGAGADPSQQEAEKIKSYIDTNKLKDQKYIGAIRYRLANQSGQDTTTLPIAFPLNQHFNTYPVLNELVIIHQTDNGSYYERARSSNSPNFSTNLALLAAQDNNGKESSVTKDEGITDYKKTAAGIPNSKIKKNANNIPKKDIGKYFKRNLRYHALLPYEGDTIIQGRHGNSIRFSGHVHSTHETDKKAYPSILIRNGESDKSMKSVKIYDYTTEDVNEDGTSIHITSGEYLSNFKDVLKVKKEANSVYPPQDKLKGDQIVVNTGRLILSTKANEIYIFSKMSTSFWTDDFFTIDTANGYRAVVQDGDYYTKVNGQSNNYIVDINDTGKICLGAEPSEVSATSKVQQAVKGNALAEVLDRLVMVLMDTYQMKTPSGITDFGPVDKSDLQKIQDDLKKILSNNNFLI